MKMHDVNRLSVDSAKYLLKTFPCVAVLGPRQVGKTTLLKQVMPQAPFFDLENLADHDRIRRDADFFLSQFDQPIIIDEAQQLPELFAALRVKIDRRRNANGQFLISGSSSPTIISQISESLAGRIATFELSGFSVDESWQVPNNPIYEYLASRQYNKILSIKPKTRYAQLHESCLKGGYPEPFLKHRSNAKDFGLWMNNYFDTYIKRDIRNLFPGLNIQNYQRFVSMLASASGQMLNASDFARSLDTTQPTIKSYFQIAHGTFVWRTIPSYDKSVKRRVMKMPRGQFRDTGLLNYLLRNTTQDQLQTHAQYGRIWETFITEELIKGFGNHLIKVEPYYYRTSNHAEIDLILEGDLGTIPFEIKSGTTVHNKHLTTLSHFVKEHNLPLGVIINQSEGAAFLAPNILQIPATYL